MVANGPGSVEGLDCRFVGRYSWGFQTASNGVLNKEHAI